MAYIDEKIKAMDAENLNYQAMLRGFKDKRNPDLIKDFSDGETHNVEESVESKNINPEAIPDRFYPSEEGANEYGIMGDTIATGYNAIKSGIDFGLQTIPAIETVVNPIGKYSGLYDYANTLFTTDVKGEEFRKISKNQIEHPDVVRYLENYKKDNVLTEDTLVKHLNNTLGLDIVSLDDLERKYKGNKEVAAAGDDVVKSLLSEGWLGLDDWHEDENFYYIKNLRPISGVNVAWTKYGDLQMPYYGIFKFDDKGQGTMMRHSATNLKESWNPVTSWIGEQGFGTQPSHEYDIELYGDPGAQTAGAIAGGVATMFTPAGARQAGITALKAPGMWKKARGLAAAPFTGMGKAVTSSKGAAITGGIASVPGAGAFDIKSRLLGE